MALDNPLDALDQADLNRLLPQVPWNVQDFDGSNIRNLHESTLARRDDLLLSWLQLIRNSATANVSAKFPFKEDATLKPSEVVVTQTQDPGTFVIDITPLELSLRFIKDLKLILTSDFVDPFISRIIMREATDPATSLIQVFVDIEISARLRLDQIVYPILTLTSKAYNDVQDNSQSSSRDNVSFNMVPQEVNGRSYFNAGVIEFNFIGAIQSQTSTSWSNGLYNDIQVEGFSVVPDLTQVEFIFEESATKLTQLSYNNLGDIQSAVPFLAKVQNWPFIQEANAGPVLTQYLPDLSITAPGNTFVYLKRVRRFNDAQLGEIYRFVFSYDENDANGNYLRTVNIGVCDVYNRPNKVWLFEIRSLGSNVINGTDPDWSDEVVTTTTDSYGSGYLRITGFDQMAIMFEALVVANETDSSGASPASPSDDETLAPPPTIGIFPDPDVILFLAGNSSLEALATDTVANKVTITEIPLDTNIHPTRNIRVVIDGIKVTRRISYGNEQTMRSFYGIQGGESLTNNGKIDPEDEWFDTQVDALKRYQLVQGRYTWRIV